MNARTISSGLFCCQSDSREATPGRWHLMLIVIMIGPAFAMDAIEGVLTCEIMLSCIMMTTLARLRQRAGVTVRQHRAPLYIHFELSL